LKISQVRAATTPSIPNLSDVGERLVGELPVDHLGEIDRFVIASATSAARLAEKMGCLISLRFDEFAIE
jgi:hypothetical protein